MNRKLHTGWSLLCLVFLLSCFTGAGPALAWGPYAQQVIAFESGGPFIEPPLACESGSVYEITLEDGLFFNQAAMPKAWEYAGRADYATSAEGFATTMAKVAAGRSGAVQAQAWKAFQIAEITGDNMYFGTYASTCHERWFYELLVDAVLHSGNFDTKFSLERVRVSSRPKLIAQASMIYVELHGGDLISKSAALAMTHDYAMAMLGERVLVQNKQFQVNALNNSTPGLWIPAMRTSADEAGKRLAARLGNPDPVTSPKPNHMERRGFELLKEIGLIVAGSGTGGLETSIKRGTVVHEIIVKDQQGAEKVVIDFLKDKIYRMKTEPRTRTMCIDVLQLLTKELYGWSPTPICRDKE